VVRNALITLVLGTIIGAIHFYASGTLRGKTIPANFVLYTNILTLIVFLILRMPNYRDRVDFSSPGDSDTQSTASGLAAIFSGVLLLSVPMMVASTHIYEGNNWVDVLGTTISVGGSVLIGGGLLRLFGRKLKDVVSSLLRDPKALIR
jgi:hypothetical protein